MDFVDEQNRVWHFLELGHHLLQPFLEITAIAGTGEQRAHVERIDYRWQQYVGNIAFDDAQGKAFGDRRLADAGFTHIERIVL